MINTEKELIAACQIVGDIANAAAWYTAGLAARIDATGKHTHQLTVSELVMLTHEHHEYHRTLRGMTVVESIDWAAAGYPFEWPPNRDNQGAAV